LPNIVCWIESKIWRMLPLIKKLWNSFRIFCSVEWLNLRWSKIAPKVVNLKIELPFSQETFFGKLLFQCIYNFFNKKICLNSFKVDSTAVFKTYVREKKDLKPNLHIFVKRWTLVWKINLWRFKKQFWFEHCFEILTYVKCNLKAILVWKQNN
jgi:hypothetical protein